MRLFGCRRRGAFGAPPLLLREALVGTDRDVHAPVRRAAGGGVVAGDGLPLALATRGDARAVDAGLHEVVADGLRAPFGQILVEALGAAVVRMAGDLDVRARVALQDLGDLEELRVGTRLQAGAAALEEDVARQRRAQRVALALDAVLIGEDLLHVALLAVHVVADEAAAERADRRADRGTLPGALAAAEGRADGGAGRGAGPRAIDGAFRRPAALAPPRTARHDRDEQRRHHHHHPT